MDTISFASETFEVHESGLVTYPVTLIREGTGEGEVSAQIKLASGTRQGRATFSKDYELSAISVNWASGDTEPKIVDLHLMNEDDSNEPIERVNLSFGEIIGATKTGMTTAVAIIQNNSGASSDDLAIGGIVQISNLTNHGALLLNPSKLKVLPLQDLPITALNWGGQTPGNLTAMRNEDSSITDWGITAGGSNIGKIQLDLLRVYTGVATVKVGYIGSGISLFGCSNGKDEIFAGGKYLNSQSEEELVEVSYRFTGRYLNICAMDIGKGQVQMRGYSINVQVV
ncbi:hypothetical protein ACE1B6_06615 [Aerosakkonemataceae cyanobacterium BLCC-F154]|uniref:Calx-beta domain-containing protein n=1 Tax=Floridaenema fluviatile BLCC-F154 TaxID=3153640 RepID=A0ABV4Y9M1_9CYAN